MAMLLVIYLTSFSKMPLLAIMVLAEATFDLSQTIKTRVMPISLAFSKARDNIILDKPSPLLEGRIPYAIWPLIFSKISF